MGSIYFWNAGLRRRALESPWKWLLSAVRTGIDIFSTHMLDPRGEPATACAVPPTEPYCTRRPTAVSRMTGISRCHDNQALDRNNSSAFITIIPFLLVLRSADQVSFNAAGQRAVFFYVRRRLSIIFSVAVKYFCFRVPCAAGLSL